MGVKLLLEPGSQSGWKLVRPSSASSPTSRCRASAFNNACPTWPFSWRPCRACGDVRGALILALASVRGGSRRASPVLSVTPRGWRPPPLAGNVRRRWPVAPSTPGRWCPPALYGDARHPSATLGIAPSWCLSSRFTCGVRRPCLVALSGGGTRRHRCEP